MKRWFLYLGLLGACACALYAFRLSSPRNIAQAGLGMAANAFVGMEAVVLPNKYNTLAAALEEKEAQLAAREAALTLSERQGVLETERDSLLALASLAMSALLLVLVGANFVLDMRRARAALSVARGTFDMRTGA